MLGRADPASGSLRADLAQNCLTGQPVQSNIDGVALRDWRFPVKDGVTVYRGFQMGPTYCVPTEVAMKKYEAPQINELASVGELTREDALADGTDGKFPAFVFGDGSS